MSGTQTVKPINWQKKFPEIRTRNLTLCVPCTKPLNQPIHSFIEMIYFINKHLISRALNPKKLILVKFELETSASASLEPINVFDIIYQ